MPPLLLLFPPLPLLDPIELEDAQKGDPEPDGDGLPLDGCSPPCCAEAGEVRFFSGFAVLVRGLIWIACIVWQSAGRGRGEVLYSSCLWDNRGSSQGGERGLLTGVNAGESEGSAAGGGGGVHRDGDTIVSSEDPS